MRSLLRIAILLVATVLALASTGPGQDNVPPSDLCDDGATAGATILEIGRPNASAFEVIADGAVIEEVPGDQGADMIPLRYRVAGTGADCVAVQTRIFRCEPLGSDCSDPNGSAILIGEMFKSLRSYPDASGVATRTNFLVLDGSTLSNRLLIESVVAGARTSISVTVGFPSDGGLDAAPTDAAPTDASADGGAGDAGPDAM